MDKIPTAAEWVTIIEAIGDQYIQLQWAEALSGMTIGISIFFAIFGVMGAMLLTAKKLGVFDQ